MLAISAHCLKKYKANNLLEVVTKESTQLSNLLKQAENRVKTTAKFLTKKEQDELNGKLVKLNEKIVTINSDLDDIDVMIEITLGMDLNESKAKTIRAHGVYIFVSDEIYQSRKWP